MQIAVVFTIILALPALAAGQNPPAYCTPSRAILPTVHYCFENKHFVLQAEKCLAKLDAEVAGRSQSLNGDYKTLAKGSASAQDAKFKNTVEDLSLAEGNFEELLSRASQARAEIQLYEKTLIYSGNPPLAFLVRFGLLASHQQDPCYRDNSRALKGKIAELDNKIQELKLANAKTGSLHLENSLHQHNLNQNAGAARRLGSTFALGSAKAKPTAVGMAHPFKPSTITGDVRKVELKR